MNWISNVVRPKIRRHPQPARDVGEFVDQVSGYGQLVYFKYVEANQFVHSEFELPHAHGRQCAPEVDLRQ